MDEVKGLKIQCMLTLTVKPELVSEKMPGSWVYGERAWMIKMGDKYGNQFFVGGSAVSMMHRLNRISIGLIITMIKPISCSRQN